MRRFIAVVVSAVALTISPDTSESSEPVKTTMYISSRVTSMGEGNE